MFRHVVVFRWSEGANEADKKRVREGLAELPDKIPSIRGYRFGDDAALAEGNFDFAVVADFDDRDGYLEYAQHEAHQALIRDRLRPILAERVAVQYAPIGDEN